MSGPAVVQLPPTEDENRAERFVRKALASIDERKARALDARRLASRGSEATQSARLAAAAEKRHRKALRRLPSSGDTRGGNT